MPRIGQEWQVLGWPSQLAGALAATLAENTDSFLASFFEPHLGQGVPFHLLDATKTSLSAPHFSQ